MMYDSLTEINCLPLFDKLNSRKLPYIESYSFHHKLYYSAAKSIVVILKKLSQNIILLAKSIQNTYCKIGSWKI